MEDECRDEVEENVQAESEEDDDSDSSSDQESDEEPAAKKQKNNKLPDDYRSQYFYERGLFALAAIVAHKVKDSHPNYVSAEQGLPTTVPVWVEHFSSRGMAAPTPDLVQFVTEMDKHFHYIHGDSVQKEKGLLTSFSDLMKTVCPIIPSKIVRAFARLRILVRVRALNKRNRDQKKEDKEKEKEDKDTRQGKVNRQRYLSSM